MPDPQLAQYYQDFDEHSRLANAYGQLEFTRTLELFARFLPPPPARVLDVGGATGAYSEALGQRGYETHLVDPMPRHVEAARKRSAIAGAAVARREFLLELLRRTEQQPSLVGASPHLLAFAFARR